MDIPIPSGLELLLSSAGIQQARDFAAYLRNGPERHSDATIDTYLFHLQTGASLVGSQAVDLLALVDRPTINRILMQIPSERDSTRRNFVSAVKKFARFCADVGFLDQHVANQVLEMRFKFKPNPKRPYLKEADLGPVLQRLLAHSYYSEQERLTNIILVSALVLTGLRNSELCDLRLSVGRL